VNTLNARSATYGSNVECGNKARYLGAADMFFEERKVEELLDRVEKRIGKAKEDVVGYIDTTEIR